VAIALLELGQDLDAVDAADDGVPLTDLAELPADRAATFDHDRSVHPLMFRFHPDAAKPH